MTMYRMADGPADYAKCHKLLRDEGLPDHELSFPTIMAKKDDELTGMLATHYSNGMIIAGPLVLKSGQRRYYTLIRLIETYERVMRAAGITSYIFSAEASNEAWLDKIDKLFHFKPYAEKDGRLFFIRDL